MMTLTSLFGNQSIAKILLFLFVNRKCYGAQLQRQLTTPLTPLQKALSRLEKGGIISSYYEGKTRIYCFDPAFPLLNELELLLKKSYRSLTPEEMRCYFCAKPLSHMQQRASGQTLLGFWKRLSAITRLTFSAKNKSSLGKEWYAKGRGEVIVQKESDTVLIFDEKGTWENEQGNEVTFSNRFRWTLDRKANLIGLEHLRLGSRQPVFLLHLSPASEGLLTSTDAHLCNDDCYIGQVQFDSRSLWLNWRVIGPQKNEEIDYYYYQ